MVGEPWQPRRSERFIIMGHSAPCLEKGSECQGKGYILMEMVYIRISNSLSTELLWRDITPLGEKTTYGPALAQSILASPPLSAASHQQLPPAAHHRR